MRIFFTFVFVLMNIRYSSKSKCQNALSCDRALLPLLTLSFLTFFPSIPTSSLVRTSVRHSAACKCLRSEHSITSTI